MSRRSWVPVPEGSDFPLANLPYGIFRRAGEPPRVGVAIGDRVLDLDAVQRAGVLDGEPALPQGVFGHGSLNPFMELGRPAWKRVRARLTELLEEGDHVPLDARGVVARALIDRSGVELLLPVEIGDYVDFYSSLEHASNMGAMLRPGGDPLPPNWRHLPVGYHGRAGSVAVSGTPVVRPSGQAVRADGSPAFGPTEMLDFELEVGFIAGVPNVLGAPVPIEKAPEHIFGCVLVNDWSARDIQRWEYAPLGPFLGKSFMTSMSPWVVTLDALEPYFVPGPEQTLPVLDYLRGNRDLAIDLDLEVTLVSPAMTDLGMEPSIISSTNFKTLYWSIAQQLAHATSNGARLRTGDLFTSGTVSGPSPGTYGSMIELTWSGERPIVLPDGSKRTWLEDGDTVAIRGVCGSVEGVPPVGFGEVRGAVVPAP
ncbi:MAG: fumarylacetoacetase [Actinomycetota bacterium]|nr:fumarylacetoacetase [Actinomycetota bacterium]